MRFYGYDEEPKEKKSVTSTEEKSNGPKTVNGVISNASLVNLREAASTSSKVLEVLKEGERVKILEKRDGFCKVFTSSNRAGYAVSKYVKEVEQ